MDNPQRPSDRYARLAMLAIVGLAVVALRLEGHIWWCRLGGVSPWSGNVHSSHNSQHLADAYSLSHVLHGMILCGVLAWAVPRVPKGWRLVITVAVESAWEVAENTPMVIARYRATTMSLGYDGDSVLNSLGDIVACVVGFALASRLGLWRSLAVIVVVEVAMLVWIKDNLTLNVVMLAHPIEAVKAWQMPR